MNRSQTHVSHLRTIVQEIKAGTFAVPAFQRDYVWEPRQVAALFDTINLGIPFGPLLLWRRLSAEGARYDLGGLTFEPSDDRSPMLVVDGQQRLGALAQIFAAEDYEVGVDGVDIRAADLVDMSVYRLDRIFGKNEWNARDPLVSAVIEASDRFWSYQVMTIILEPECETDYVIETYVRLAREGSPVTKDDLERALALLGGDR